MAKKRILISTYKTIIGLVEVMEEFDGLYQKIYITNETNRTNFLSITKNKWDENKYVAESRLDVGDLYITYFKYENGKTIFEKRFNKLKRTVYTKEIIASTKNGDVFLTDYNKEKSITFNINKIHLDGRFK